MNIRKVSDEYWRCLNLLNIILIVLLHVKLIWVLDISNAILMWVLFLIRLFTLLLRNIQFYYNGSFDLNEFKAMDTPNIILYNLINIPLFFCIYGSNLVELIFLSTLSTHFEELFGLYFKGKIPVQHILLTFISLIFVPLTFIQIISMDVFLIFNLTIQLIMCSTKAFSYFTTNKSVTRYFLFPIIIILGWILLYVTCTNYTFTKNPGDDNRIISRRILRVPSTPPTESTPRSRLHSGIKKS